jgi:hypothetical protein
MADGRLQAVQFAEVPVPANNVHFIAVSDGSERANAHTPTPVPMLPVAAHLHHTTLVESTLIALLQDPRLPVG